MAKIETIDNYGVVEYYETNDNHKGPLTDLVALDVSEYFTYVYNIHLDSYYGWPSIGSWYAYKKLYHAQNQT